MGMKAILATAALLAALVTTAPGVAHALPDDNVRCRVDADGAMWCEDYETGRTWEAAPGGTYPDNPYCPGTSNWKTVQCGD
jgi:hypothetical protein